VLIFVAAGVFNIYTAYTQPEDNLSYGKTPATAIDCRSSSLGGVSFLASQRPLLAEAV